MTAGPFKRFASFAIDFVLIISFVFTLWRIFGSGTLERLLDYEAREGLEHYTVLAFHFLGFTLVNYLYQGITKGQTLGRRFLFLRLSGRIDWWSLFMREVLWKAYIWAFAITFINIDYFGFALYIYLALWIADFVLIAFSRDRRTIRDKVTRTKVILDEVVYPF